MEQRPAPVLPALVLLACALAATGAIAQRARTPSPADIAYLRSLALPATTIADVIVNLNGVPTDIGDIEATHAPNASNTRAIMLATFRLAPEHARLASWLQFHWVQAITYDDCPETYFARRLPRPHIDPPKDGWDYMYAGAGRTDPILDIPDFGHFIDAEPWYFNSTGEAANTIPGISHDIGDAPGLCDFDGVTTFDTWLVAEGPGQVFCLIRGFRWSISTAAHLRAGPDDLGAPTAAHSAVIDAALANSAFAGWRSSAGCPFQWGYDVAVGVDDAARRVAMTFQITGPSRGVGAIFAAGSAVAPVPTPVGMLHIDPATLVFLTTVPLSAAGYGELRISLPAADVARLRVASQAVVSNATSVRLTNYVLIGSHYADGLAWELLAARYNSAHDHFWLVGRGVPGRRIDASVQNGAEPRRSLGSVTVPPLGTFGFGHTRPGFGAPGNFTVDEGARNLIRLR